MPMATEEKYSAEFAELSKYDNAIFTDYLDTGMSIEELADDYEVPRKVMKAFLLWHGRIKNYDKVRRIDECKEKTA